MDFNSEKFAGIGFDLEAVKNEQDRSVAFSFRVLEKVNSGSDEKLIVAGNKPTHPDTFRQLNQLLQFDKIVKEGEEYKAVFSMENANANEVPLSAIAADLGADEKL